MLIPSPVRIFNSSVTSLSRRVNANSQHTIAGINAKIKLIKKGEC